MGEHTIQAEFTDGKAEAKFTIQASAGISLPQTGDSSNALIYALIGLIALSGLGLTTMAFIHFKQRSPKTLKISMIFAS